MKSHLLNRRVRYWVSARVALPTLVMIGSTDPSRDSGLC